ncbi:hypothetical protein [Streptomyces sp. NPDC048002]
MTAEGTTDLPVCITLHAPSTSMSIGILSVACTPLLNVRSTEFRSVM